MVSDEFRDLANFFYLNSDSDEFKFAIKPRSCGGDYQFEQYAAFGDRLLDFYLIQYYLSIDNTMNKGEINKNCKKIHNETILVKISKELQIDKILHPLSNQIVEDNDLKECIESLLYANYKVNKMKSGLSIITKLIKIYEKNNLIDSDTSSKQYPDPISALNNIYNSYGLIFRKVILEPEKIGGTDNRPIFQVDKEISFYGQNYHIISKIYNNKNEARKNAALIFLSELNGKNLIYTSEKEVNEITLPIKHSFINPQLVFDIIPFDDKINISKNTDELLSEWIERKKQDPFNMIFSLSARLSNFSFSLWTCSIEFGNFTLLNVNFNKINYFNIGFDKSKTKSKKDAAKKIIESSDLINQINTKYNGYTI